MTVLRPGLADSLNTLKLSGMLETLDARLAKAHGGDLGHLESFQILCDDEIARREAQGMARRLHRARFDTAATLEGFDFTASPTLPAVQIRDLAALRWLHAVTAQQADDLYELVSHQGSSPYMIANITITAAARAPIRT
nr:ATP-binding protein [Actinospica robiniae]